jgi:hypothetical protein
MSNIATIMTPMPNKFLLPLPKMFRYMWFVLLY